MTTHKQSHTNGRAPITKTLRKVVTSFEDVVDDVLDRGQQAERDARRLVSNLIKPHDDEDEGGEEKTRSKAH